jgi:hypothetical protein
MKTRLRLWLLFAAVFCACSRSNAEVEAAAAGSELEVTELRYQGNNGAVVPAELAEELYTNSLNPFEESAGGPQPGR